MYYNISMIKRDLETKIKDASKKIGVISIIGPRQSGKTTLAKKVFPNYAYYNLENIRTREQIEADPKAFLEEYKNGVILDEVQKYPELLSYIQVVIDEEYSPARFIITGSENLLLSEKISQSLAGRVAIFELLPLSIMELNGSNLHSNLYQQILNGFYPRLYSQELKPSDIYPDYIVTYIERDVRQIKNIGKLSNFQRFMQLLAGRVGQILNLTSLSNDVGVDYKTIDAWISVLESTYIAFRLQPYFENFGKRIIKSPKLYFYDTGLLSYLLGIDTTVELQTHHAIGSIFENLVITEFVKQIKNTRSSSHLYFWRNSEGNEIDLIVKNGQELYPIEVKLGSSFSKDYLKGISTWNKLIQKESLSSIVYTGDEMKVKNTTLLNWKDLDKLKKVAV